MKARQTPTSIWHKILTGLLAAVCVFAITGLIASAYAGAINPVNHPMASVVAMTFPLWLIGTIVAVAIIFFMRWRVALIGVAGLCIALPAILNYCPLNLPRKAAEDADTFTLMTYNVFDFVDQTEEYPGDINPTLSYILREDPDIVCAQEVGYIGTNQSHRITAAQVDSLYAQYPYIYMDRHILAILSKFPIEPVQTGIHISENEGAGDIACYRAEIKGRKVTIFIVHLQSFYLQRAEREMFMKLTRLQGSESEIKEMQRHLVDKICEAAPHRVRETEELIKYIDKYGGPNVIVCGDFNDIPGCYSLRLLKDHKLKEVYPEVGFGPMITYNSERFYFRIDHILYRGDIRPLSMVRSKIYSSDHYPVKATFEILNQ